MCSSSAGKIKLFWPSLIPFGLALASVIVLFSQNFVLVHGAKECFDWNMLMANLGTICAIIIIVIVGIICIFQAIFFAIRQIYDMRLPWLGVLLFFVALWAYCASSLTVLFCLGEETIQVLEYVSLMTIPLPILYFTWHTSNCRYHLLLVFGSLTYGNIFLQCAMASAGAIGIDDYRPVTHVLFVADLVVCIYCLARHSKKSSHPQNNFMLTF